MSLRVTVTVEGGSPPGRSRPARGGWHGRPGGGPSCPGRPGPCRASRQADQAAAAQATALQQKVDQQASQLAKLQSQLTDMQTQLSNLQTQITTMAKGPPAPAAAPAAAPGTAPAAAPTPAK